MDMEYAKLRNWNMDTQKLKYYMNLKYETVIDPS